MKHGRLSKETERRYKKQKEDWERKREWLKPLAELIRKKWAETTDLFGPDISPRKGKSPGGPDPPSYSEVSEPTSPPGGHAYPLLAIHGLLNTDVQPSTPLEDDQKEELHTLLTTQLNLTKQGKEELLRRRDVLSQQLSGATVTEELLKLTKQLKANQQAVTTQSDTKRHSYTPYRTGFHSPHLPHQH